MLKKMLSITLHETWQVLQQTFGHSETLLKQSQLFTAFVGLLYKQSRCRKVISVEKYNGTYDEGQVIPTYANNIPSMSDDLKHLCPGMAGFARKAYLMEPITRLIFHLRH